jgi:hypothetical protein
VLRKDIIVHPSVQGLGGSLTEALESLLPVRFRNCPPFSDCREGDIVLSLSGNDDALDQLAAKRVRCFHFARPSTEAGESNKTSHLIRFADSCELDPMLRGRTIRHHSLPGLSAVRTHTGDQVLAYCADRPVWVFRRGIGHILSLSLPGADGERKPFDFLNGYNFLQLLPLVHFLRQVSAGLGWGQPALRACFIFDDPNLHWPSYGFLSYGELVQQAKTDRFHVAFATVPVDAWGSQSRTVRLFKENPAHLSLLIHGNNHTREELGRIRTHGDALRLLGQALRRVERLERITGVHVDRVVVPPHEALADAVVLPMLTLGLEGVSLTPWSLRDWNPNRQWPSTFGLQLAEITDGGFPALARYDLSESCEGPILIASFLGIPIVLCGHHTSVASGLDILARAARVVNSLGDVQWCSTEAMLRSNYLYRREDCTLWIRPYSCHLEVSIPDGVRILSIADLQESDGVRESTRNWLCKRLSAQGTRTEAGTSFNVAPGETVRLISPDLGTVYHQDIEMPEFSAWAVSRRALCEVRDRLLVLKARRKSQTGVA